MVKKDNMQLTGNGKSLVFQCLSNVFLGACVLIPTLLVNFFQEVQENDCPQLQNQGSVHDNFKHENI